METQDLINYISESRQQGMSDEQIKQNLLGSGWSESDVDQALIPVSQIINNDGWYQGLIKNKLLAVAIVVSIIGVAGASYWFLYRDQSDKLIEPEMTQEPQGTDQESQVSPVTGQPQLFFQKPKGTISAAPGETIGIELFGPGIAEVLLVAPNFAETAKADGSNIFKFKYVIPVEIIGNIQLGAVGSTNDNLPIESDELNINISLASAGKITSIRETTAPNEQIVLFVGSTWPLRVFGTFSDGVERDITSDPGTEYTLWPGQPSNTEIIRVDTKGVITAVSAGQRSIIINHKNRSSTATAASVTVIVE